MNENILNSSGQQRIAVLCNNEGVITKVIYNDLYHSNEELAGKSFPNIFEKSSFQKALSFLVRLKQDGMISDWEFDIPVNTRILLIYCSGLITDEGLLIMGANSRSAMHMFFKEMMQINNKQTNMIRKLTKENTELATPKTGSEENSYDEISKLNNELVNLQRELIKKNKELERLNREVEKLSLTDTLTNVFNRRGLDKIAKREIERAKRSGNPLSVIMLDIDHFKKLNDTYGHPAGDDVLRELANRCKGEIRGVDLVARYGGEEFCVVLPGTRLNDAIKVAERIRASIAQNPFSTVAGELEVTASLGVTEFEGSMKDIDTVIQLADKALYRAKKDGRNMVFAY